MGQLQRKTWSSRSRVEQTFPPQKVRCLVQLTASWFSSRGPRTEEVRILCSSSKMLAGPIRMSNFTLSQRCSHQSLGKCGPSISHHELSSLNHNHIRMWWWDSNKISSKRKICRRVKYNSHRRKLVFSPGSNATRTNSLKKWNLSLNSKQIHNLKRIKML